MANKTVQAFKITVSWTPNDLTASKMLNALVLPGRMLFTSGRLALKLAIKADYGNSAHQARVDDRIKAVRKVLESQGEVHSFKVTAGAVPLVEAEDPPEVEQPKPEGDKK